MAITTPAREEGSQGGTRRDRRKRNAPLEGEDKESCLDPRRGGCLATSGEGATQ